MKAAISIITLFSVFLPLNSTFSQPGTQYKDLPSARGSMPEGEVGVDFNLVNSSGEKEGMWIRVWPNGSLYYKGYFDFGKPAGDFLYFYDSGKLMSVLNHMTDNISAIHYRKNGSVQASGFYNHSVGDSEPTKEGSWGYFDKNSLQRRQETYSRGVLDGDFWVVDRKGLKVEEGSYVDGTKNGEWSDYFENGKLRQRVNYLNDELEGEFEAYHLNSNIRIQGKYLEGHEDGSWKTFLEDGSMEMIIKYSFGKKVKEIRINGTFENTYPDGRSESEYTYKDKELDGLYRVWHDCGEYILESFTDQETGEKMQRRVLEGTQVKEEGEYSNGVLDGPRYFYNMHGKLVKKEVYENGVLVD